MSRGLGKIQRKILELLKDYKKEWEYYDNLFYYVIFGINHFNKMDDMHELYDKDYYNEYWNKKPSESEKQSFWRSMRTLKKRSLIEIKMMTWKDCFGAKNTGKKVKCLVD